MLISKFHISLRWIVSVSLSARVYNIISSVFNSFLQRAVLPKPASPNTVINFLFSSLIFSIIDFLSISYSPLSKSSIFWEINVLLVATASASFVSLVVYCSSSCFRRKYIFFWNSLLSLALATISYKVIKCSSFLKARLPIW